MTYPGVVATPGLAPDAAVAVDLIERIGIDDWPRRSEGLTHSQPYLRLSDAAFFEDLQAWLASRAGDQPSFVQSAVANLRRILDDLLLVVHYDMVPRGEALWVRKSYHGAHGGTSSPREVEFFQMHTLLIQNLAAELTRAINLVLARVRQADDRVLQTSALALVDTGSPDAPMHPAQYTPEEQTLPQPYPGLRDFPTVISSRDVGELGDVHEGRPRTPADFEQWIDELIKRTGGRPSEPPGPEIPPRALLRPELSALAGPSAEERGHEAFMPPVNASPPVRPSPPPGSASRVKDVLLTVATICGTVLAVAVAPLPLAAAVVVACVTAVVLVWLRPDISMTMASLIILSAASLGAVVGLVIPGGEAEPPPLAAQLDDVVADADSRGQYPAVRRAAQLHSDAPGSHLFVLRDQSQRPGGLPREFASPPSDEVRVYDEVVGRLVLRMRFQPQNFGEVQQGPDGDSPGYRFRVADIADLDKNGTAEVLGSFERISFASGPLPLPFLISWDEEASRYRLDALLTQPPDLRVPQELTPAALAGYRKPSVVRDQFSKTKLTGYPADIVEVRQALRGPVVLAGYPEQSAVGFTGRYEAKGWFLDLGGRTPQLTECTPPKRHRLVRVPTPADVPDALARALIGAPEKPGCGQP